MRFRLISVANKYSETWCSQLKNVFLDLSRNLTLKILKSRRSTGKNKIEMSTKISLKRRSNGNRHKTTKLW
jgi:hypothetical protein